MRKLLDTLADRQHLLVLALSLWLIVTSPLIVMRRGLPPEPGVFDYAHIGFGLVLAALTVAYAATSVLGGRWREYFPWLAGDLSGVKHDIACIARGRIPSAGGAGLFSVIEGIGLMLLAATALTGVGWLVVEGSRAAIAWREWHMLAANGFVAFVILHAAAASLHLLDFLRD